MSIAPVTTRDYEARTADADRRPTQLKDITTKETNEMLLYEELSRARIRDLEEGVRAQRERGSVRAARRWSRVARWANRRAERYRET
ncbi:hypothetical protein GCM10023192_61920 [Amycolatopsis samaneae]